jgi:F-type H+-transporting ATPase subunit gamma
MRGLVGIRRRVKSVIATQKITKAMELVATAKLKKSRDLFYQVKDFADEVELTIDRLVSNTPDIVSPYLSNLNAKDIDYEDASINKTEANLYIVLTSNLGLCGGYNVNVIKEAVSHINKEVDYVYAIGQKGILYLHNHNYQIIGESLDVLEGSFATMLGKLICDWFIAKKVAKVYLVYTQYQNPVTFNADVKQILPLGHIQTNTKVRSIEKEITYYPDPASVLNEIIPLFIETLITSLSINSQVSEQAARRNAMENSTDNAQEIIEGLQIEYNKARQAAITQEINEIVAGADAHN